MTASPLDPLAALAATSPTSWSRLSGPCLIGRLAADDETLRFLVEESGHPGSRISEACKRAGIAVSGETITKHRRRACGCSAAE